MKKLLLSCLAALCLVGCSSTPKEEEIKKTVCTLEETGIEVSTTFEHDGTKVLKQINTNTITLSEVGLTKEQIDIAATTASENYSKITGVTYTYEYIGDDTFTETTIIDFTAAPIKDLQDAGIVEAGDADFIGIKETLELNSGQGIECQDVTK